MTNKIRSRYILFALLFTLTITTILVALNALSYIAKVAAQSSTLDASNVYETKAMTLGSNIKNLVILLPNEAHESQHLAHPSSDQRHINQPYIPQNATVTKGTSVLWFNGDVDHDHKITLTRQNHDSDNKSFDSDVFAYNTATQPVMMNDTGSFSYSEADVNDEDPDFVMNGTINVVDQSESATTTTTTTTANTTDTPSTNIDTVGTLMVPTEDLTTYTSDLENRGFSILSTHNFNDIRDVDPQTLIVWATSPSGSNSKDDIILQLSQISSSLPYS